MASKSTSTQHNPAIAGISYLFPAGSTTVRQMALDGQLESTPEMLESFGFDRVHVASGESPYELALEAARKLLVENEVDPASIGLVIYGGTPGSMAFSSARDSAVGDFGPLHSAGWPRIPLLACKYDPTCRTPGRSRLISSRAPRFSPRRESRGRSASPRESSAHSACRRSFFRPKQGAKQFSIALPTLRARCSSSGMASATDCSPQRL